jgi:hypothetical protein
MNEEDKDEGGAKSFDEVMGLLNDVLKKVTDRGASTLHEKLDQAVTSFHGELKKIDEELDKPDDEKK